MRRKTLAMRTITVIVTIVVTSAALAGVPAAAPDCRGKRSAPMHAGFDKAHASFCDHAARALKLSPDRVLVSPIEEDPSVQLDQRIGAAWAFYGSSKDHADRQVRGWTTADGTVITPPIRTWACCSRRPAPGAPSNARHRFAHSTRSRCSASLGLSFSE